MPISHSTLTALRQTPQPTPAGFVAAQFGCWIQYYDDTPAKDPTKALSARTFDPIEAAGKKQEQCATCFSLQVFGNARTREHLLCYRNLGVDVDLVIAAERHSRAPEEIDQRKDEYLAGFLLTFPLTPHWLIETMHGFHIIYRIMPQCDKDGIGVAAALNRRLVSLLRGDLNAVLRTQVLRVPVTFQFKDPEHPFLCQLLLDNASTIPPYDLTTVQSVLDAREVIEEAGSKVRAERASAAAAAVQKRPSQPNGLGGVPEGRRNVTAASIVGGIVGRLPEYLWETAGWGGLKEWNQRNPVPLPEGELRSVFQSITRRERAARTNGGRSKTGEERRYRPPTIGICVEKKEVALNDSFSPSSPSLPC